MGNGNTVAVQHIAPEVHLLTPHGEREQRFAHRVQSVIRDLLTPHGEREPAEPLRDQIKDLVS